METDSGQRAMSRRREGAKERRERRLRAEARIRLQLCRDAVRIASHRGGDGCRRAHTNASTQTAPVDEPPVTEYVTPAPAVPHVAPVLLIEYVSPAPVIEYVAPVIGSFPPYPCTTKSIRSRLLQVRRLRTLRKSLFLTLLIHFLSLKSLLNLCSAQSIRNRSLQGRLRSIQLKVLLRKNR